jgi:hypothetical protein
MKGRALKPCHPISTTICNIPHTQSEADEHKKHDKQKRDEKGQGIHEMSFQAPKQNTYAPSWYCFYAVDQISKQHACAIPHHHKIFESIIASQATTQCHFIKEQERQFSLRGHQQSQFSAVSFNQEECHTSATSFCIQGADSCTQGQRYHNSQQSVSHQKSNHQQSDYPSSQSINSSQFINSSQISQRTTESLVTLLQFVLETAKIL